MDTAEPNDEMLSDEPDATAASAPDDGPGFQPAVDDTAEEEPATVEEREPYPPVFAGEDEDVAAEPAAPTPEPLFPMDDEVTADVAPEAEVAPAEPLSLEEMVSELGTDDVAVAAPMPAAATPSEDDAEGQGGEDTEPSGEADGSESAEAEGEAAEAGEDAEEGEAEVTSWRDTAAAEAAVSGLVRERLSTRLPFFIYGGVWVVFVGVMTYFMWPLSHQPFIDAAYYSYFVLGCAALLAVGPIMAVAVWGFSRVGASDAEREGLVRAVWLRAASWMAVGAALMWVVLYVLDLHRIGVIGS